MADIEVRRAGSTVAASPGDRIVIRLPENGGTGYQWSVRHLGGPVEMESTELVFPNDLRPGAAGERIVVLRATTAGMARVSLQHKREWEPEPSDRFDVTVTVTDQ